MGIGIKPCNGKEWDEKFHSRSPLMFIYIYFNKRYAVYKCNLYTAILSTVNPRILAQDYLILADAKRWVFI